MVAHSPKGGTSAPSPVGCWPKVPPSLARSFRTAFHNLSAAGRTFTTLWRSSPDVATIRARMGGRALRFERLAMAVSPSAPWPGEVFLMLVRGVFDGAGARLPSSSAKRTWAEVSPYAFAEKYFLQEGNQRTHTFVLPSGLFLLLTTPEDS